MRVNESATRFLLDSERTGASLAIENPLGSSVRAHIRIDLIDTDGRVRSHGERDEMISAGRAQAFIPLAFQFSNLSDTERGKFLLYRLRYSIKDFARTDEKPIVGVISLSEITPDIFDVRVVASEFAREASRYTVRVRAAHPVTGLGIAGVGVEAQIEIDNEDGKPATTLKASGITDAEGCATLVFNLPNGIKAESADIKVTARHGTVVQKADDTVHFDQMSRIFITTDKPLYQPGQTVHARALVFSPSMLAVANEETPFKIEDPEGTVVFRAALKTSRFGIASVDWQIPENTRLGEYSVSFGRPDDSYAIYRIKISRYDLPNFTTKVEPDRKFYLPGQNAEVSVSADYLFGQAVKRGHVRVVRETEREWNYREQKWETKEEETYEGDTDKDGRFLAHVNLKKEHEDLKDSDWRRFEDVNYAAYFTDASTGRTEQRRFDLRVTKEAIHVYIIGDTYDQSSRLPLQFYLSTFYADGTPVECEVAIGEGSEDDEKSYAPSKRIEERPFATVKTNSYGLAKVSGLKPALHEGDDEVYLRFTARDARGATGHRTENINYRDNPAIRVTTDKSLYRAGEPLKVNIASSEKDLNVHADVVKEWQVLRSQSVHLHEGRAMLTLPFDDKFRDEITVAVYADIGADDSIHDSHTVLYPNDRDLKLDVRSIQDTYKPGEEAHVDFNIHGADGRAIESALGIVVFDRSVEERARTDADFGAGFNLYGNYGNLLGWDDRIAGVSKKDLEKLDLSKPQPEEIYLLAEVLLNKSRNYYPKTFGGDDYALNPVTVFAPLINAQLKLVRDALNAHYKRNMDYPASEADLRRILSEAGIDFDNLKDPWGTNYRAVFSVENDRDVLKILSAGADKRFGTTDDFPVAMNNQYSAVFLSWPYFRAIGEAIDSVVQKYHARTGGYIRDAATFKREMLRERVDFDALRDRWGEPYRLEFGADGVHYFVKVLSGGPDRKFEPSSASKRDDFTLWTSLVDYFAETRARIDAALNSYLKETHKFPQGLVELREALKRSRIDYAGLRDAWGHAYYATFKTESRFTDRVEIETRAKYGEKGQTHTAVTPVTQKVGVVTLRSAGADGQIGTADDFDAATFSLVISEQDRDDSKPKAVRSFAILTGKGGAIVGTVFDPNGAVIPNATVRATLSSTEQFYEAATDDEGKFVLRDLPSGLYEVRVTATGFRNSVVTNVMVSSSNILSLDLTLQPGGTTETVTVT
ncbi:MAG: hypothetical protein DMF68_12140, partial [Acidobacteria bacterium]